MGMAGDLTLRYAGPMTQDSPGLPGKPDMHLAEGDHRTPDTVDIHRSLEPAASRGCPVTSSTVSPSYSGLAVASKNRSTTALGMPHW